MLTQALPSTPRTPGVAVWWSGITALLISTTSSFPLFLLMSVGYSHLPEKVSSNALQTYVILFMSGLFTAFYCSIPVLIRHFGDVALLQIIMLIGVFSLGRRFGHPSLSFRSAGRLRGKIRKTLASEATARAS
jgi:hypothetical protein